MCLVPVCECIDKGGRDRRIVGFALNVGGIFGFFVMSRMLIFRKNNERMFGFSAYHSRPPPPKRCTSDTKHKQFNIPLPSLKTKL